MPRQKTPKAALIVLATGSGALALLAGILIITQGKGISPQLQTIISKPTPPTPSPLEACWVLCDCKCDPAGIDTRHPLPITLDELQIKWTTGTDQWCGTKPQASRALAKCRSFCEASALERSLDSLSDESGSNNCQLTGGLDNNHDGDYDDRGDRKPRVSNLRSSPRDVECFNVNSC